MAYETTSLESWFQDLANPENSMDFKLGVIAGILKEHNNRLQSLHDSKHTHASMIGNHEAFLSELKANHQALYNLVDKLHPLTQEDIRSVVQEAVQQTLTTLGIPKDPQEMQSLMGYLKETHKEAKNTKKEVKGALIRWAIPPIVIALWEGFRHFIK